MTPVTMTPLIKGLGIQGGSWDTGMGRGCAAAEGRGRWRHHMGDKETKRVGKVLFTKQPREKGMVAEGVEGPTGGEGSMLRED